MKVGLAAVLIAAGYGAWLSSGVLILRSGLRGCPGL